jgi:PAS domain S-box-containing protein
MSSSVPQPAELARMLLDASLDGVASFDREFRFTSWNMGMERIYGFRDDEALGRVAFELLPCLSD